MSSELSLPSSGYSADVPIFPLATHPTLETIKVISSYLSHLTATNDSSPVKGDLTRFHARTIPTIDILAYLQRILKYAPCGNEVFLAVLVYFERIAKRAEFTMSKKRKKKVLMINSYNVHRLLITGVMIASKLFSDVFFLNSHYAKVGGLPVQELNQLEIEFLIFTDFNLHITVEQLQETGNRLLRHSSTIRSVSESFQNRLVIRDDSDVGSRQSGRSGLGGSDRLGLGGSQPHSGSSVGRGGAENGSGGTSLGRLSSGVGGGSGPVYGHGSRDHVVFNSPGQHEHNRLGASSSYTFTDIPQPPYYSSPAVGPHHTAYLPSQPQPPHSHDQVQTGSFGYAPSPPHHQSKSGTGPDSNFSSYSAPGGIYGLSTTPQVIPVAHQHTRYHTPPPSNPSDRKSSWVESPPTRSNNAAMPSPVPSPAENDRRGSQCTVYSSRVMDNEFRY
ncbi:cyclin-domain-containing protein [Gonapodya prolifera JEL478]|uniref:Cyclin-domain-containing protein n=1 Tax=Gonapodya prolifera (strain JEL478) TaxID=1344416 RepID=A0A139A6I2_GONPJ|nr:cyclin-domain-containing protein [Gonapodya prolifera JEL478]|eukprot:KXS12055.1 cyclin-domain-containing protein [Gonapodya prolifera JEL478]